MELKENVVELKDRRHSLNLNKLTIEDADQISKQLGDRVRNLCDDCVAQANRLLNIYGLESKMQIVIQEIGAAPTAPKIKRARAKKTGNLKTKLTP